MSYKILFSDIDGTLLDAERTLSQKTTKVLSKKLLILVTENQLLSQ